MPKKSAANQRLVELSFDLLHSKIASVQAKGKCAETRRAPPAIRRAERLPKAGARALQEILVRQAS
jgi:hypothetical protein